MRLRKLGLPILVTLGALVVLTGWLAINRARTRGLFAERGRPAAISPDSTTDIENTTDVLADTARLVTANVSSTGWTRFRGPNGTGISLETNIPVEWSDTKNLRWKCKLPGAGSSSPILTEKFVLLSSYSGYGQSRGEGSLNDLKRQIACIDRRDGTIVWEKSFDSVQREDPYQGMGVPEHGYATNTGVTDGASAFMFLGKSGVIALDLSGQEKWRVSVGTESGNREWGSASSLILYNDLVIVNAAEESQTLYGINKETGAIVWKAPAAALEMCYSTPAICPVNDSRDDLIIAVPGEIWGLSPMTGKLLWYAQTSMTGNLSPSVIVDRSTIYAFGGYQSSGSIAVRAGGEGDVTKSHVIWSSRTTSYVPTPVLHAGKFFWIDDRGMFFCMEASNGAQLQRSRGPDFGGGRPVYASPILIDGKIYIQSRWGGVVVLEPNDEMKILSHNRLESDASTFNATPAVGQGQLFLRSDEYLYCIQADDAS